MRKAYLTPWDITKIYVRTATYGWQFITNAAAFGNAYLTGEQILYQPRKKY